MIPVQIEIGKESPRSVMTGRGGPALDTDIRELELGPGDKVVVVIKDNCLCLQKDKQGVYFTLSEIVLKIFNSKTPYAVKVLAAQAWVGSAGMPNEISDALEQMLGDHVG